MLSGAHRRTSRSALVLLQLLVFATYIFGPTAAFAVDPTPEPTPAPTADPTATPTSEPIAAPTISSDKEDYAPGELVTLTSSGWAGGEAVHVFVNDDQGQTWSRSVWVSASADGGFVDQFNLPNHFVATYRVTATGDVSGTATTSFTDGNVKARSNTTNTTFALIATEYTNSQACTGSVVSGDPSTSPTVGFSGGAQFSRGVPNQNSIKLQAAATSNEGQAFIGWTGERASDTFVNLGSRTICVPGDFTGARTYVANYASNTAPVANGQLVTTNEETAKVITLSGTDANGQNLTFAIVTGPSHGTLGSLGAPICSVTSGASTCTSTVTYTPTANYNGPDSFTFKVNDGLVDSNVATVSITVTAVNDAPTCANDSGSTAEDATLNDTLVCADVDGSTLTYSRVTDAANGTVTVNANGTFSYVPNANYTGPDSFTFKANDGTVDSNTATYSITVTAVNDAPVTTLSADNDLAVSEGTSHTYSFTVSDVDAGATFAVVSVSCGDNGSQSGTTTTTATGGSFVCSFADGPASSIVSVQVKDDVNANSNTATQTVTVANVKPSITLTGANSADEGQTKTYAYVVTDPGADTHTVTTACGDNGAKVAGSDNTVDGTFQCFFADGPATTNVTATVTDSDGATDTDGQVVTVSVSNVKPTVVLSGPAGSDEGDTQTYTYTVSDPGTDTLTIVEDCGANGQLTDTVATNSFECSFPDGPASSTVSVSANDEDPGAATVDSIAVTVANVGPTVTLTGAASVNEGSTHTYSFTTSDPGADSFVLGATECGTGGSQVGTDTFNATTGAGSFDCSFADGPASPTISVTVSDDDGASDSDTIGVTVANVKPSIVLSGDATADEGSTHTYSFYVTDPGTDTHTLTTSCGAEGTKVSETYSDLDGMGNVVCFFADGPATTNVTATVTDSDGATDTDGQVVVVTVNNVAPIVTLTGSASANEGGTVSYSYTTDDPGSEVFTRDAQTCDGGTLSNDSFNPATGSGSFDCTFADNGTYNVSVTVGDGFEADSDTRPVTVANVAPSVRAGADATVNEGSAFAQTGSFADPGADAPWTGTVDYGDGSGVQPLTVNQTTKSYSLNHTYADNGIYTVTVTITDKDAATGSDTVQVTVTNVAPTANAGADQTVAEGSSVTLNGTYTDPGSADTHTESWSVSASNGQVVAAGSGSSYSFTPNDNGTYTVTYTVTDDDGGIGSDTAVITVTNVAPVVALSGAGTSNEGQTQSYSFSWTDPGADTWSRTVSCGATGVPSLSTFNETSKSGTFSCTWADDAPSGSASDIETVSVTVSDDDGGSDTKSKSVTIHNLAPVINETATTATYAAGTGTVTSSLTYADAGIPDTETAVFKYTWTGTTSGTVTNTYPGRASTATVADALHLDPGCYSILVEMSVTDDDTGSDAFSINVGSSLDFYDATFRAPIQENVRNIAKYGNVVPVKVELLSMCVPGTTITNRTLHITIVLGDQTGQEDDIVPDTLIAESVSGADTGTQMRVSGVGYIYNLSTRGMLKDKEYTIRIRDGSSTGPIILKALFMPKK